jgi:hypothetical protein
MTAIQIKRGTASNWYDKNPVLKNGELGIETDTKKIKLGNGTNQWRSLAYVNVVPSDLANTIGSYLEVSEKGEPGGLATLNLSGVIPDSQIPSTIARDTEIVTSYNNLTDKPNLFSGSYTNLTDKPTLFSGSYTDLSDKPTIPSLTGYATETYVGTAISNLVDSAPGTLNTLSELAAAINDDASYAATLTTALGTKVSLTGEETISNKTISGNLNLGAYGDYIKSDQGGYKIHAGSILEIESQTGRVILSGDQGVHIGSYDDSGANLVVKKEELDTKSDKLSTISAKSTSYSIQTNDLGKIIEMSDGGTISIEDSESFPEGFTLDILQTGSSQVTVAGIGTTVINATPGLKLRTRWSSATLIKRTLNVWVLLGDLAA